MLLFEFLDRAARRHPDAPAVVDGQGVTSYEDLRRASCRLANALLASGLQPGDRVASLAPNHPSFFTCAFGLSRTPFIWLPLNARATAEENIDVARRFEARWLLVHSAFADFIPLAQAALPDLIGIVCVDRALAATPSMADWSAAQPVKVPALVQGPQDCVVLRTTGGTTGQPKAVMRTSISWSLMIADYLMALPCRRPTVNLVVTPLTHAAGEVAIPIFARGGTNVILDTTNPLAVLRAIEAHRVTSVFLPPTLIYTILALPDARQFDLSSLEHVLYGSAPMSVQKLREARELFGPVLVQLYGLTEALSTLSIMTPEEHEEALNGAEHRLASCGRGGPLFAIDVADEDGRRLPPGETGEIICRSNSLMAGYFQDSVATAGAIRDGWLFTGDVGFKDEQGFVYIVDRKKDIIISGAINIFPGEVEQVIFQHPAIENCAVVGVPDDKWGEAVTAVCEVKSGQPLDPEELIAFCKARLGSIKAPKQVLVWDRLPRTNVGKVSKKELRNHFWEASGRQI